MIAAVSIFAAFLTMTPDYAGITIPADIAPLNFNLSREAKVTLTAKNGTTLQAEGRSIRFDAESWHAFLADAKGGEYELRIAAEDAVIVATNRVSADPIDRYLTYRLIPPGCEAFDAMGIYERDLFTSGERCLYSNRQSTRSQCVNCHTTNRGDPETFLFHRRAEGAGTVIASPKYGLGLHQIRRGRDDFGSAAYPAWHPSGDYIAFSINETRQAFFLANRAKLEVADAQGDLVLYSLRDRSLSVIEDAPQTLECFPTWSPDGKTLYSVQAKIDLALIATNGSSRIDGLFKFLAAKGPDSIRYSLVARDFDLATRQFSPPRTVIAAENVGASILFPRMTPDGRYVIVTVAMFGVFPIWHRESELAIVDLLGRSMRVIDEINSREADSYHSISSNGRWMVFSSRRDDGTYTRPYFTHFDPVAARFTKPFLLPVADPAEHERRMLSYNVPEFAVGPVKYSSAELRKVR